MPPAPRALPTMYVKLPGLVALTHAWTVTCAGLKAAASGTCTEPPERERPCPFFPGAKDTGLATVSVPVLAPAESAAFPSPFHQPTGPVGCCARAPAMLKARSVMIVVFWSGFIELTH